MIRKPQPKEAARAIVHLFKSKGVSVSYSHALEAVATVEGYNDWNTMAADVDGASSKTPSAAKPTLDFPVICDELGPFTVTVDGGEYTSVASFSTACSIAEFLALDEITNGRLVGIHKAGPMLASRIAAYLAPDALLRTYECDLFNEDPEEIGLLGPYLDDQWDTEHVHATRQELLDYLVDRLNKAKNAPDSSQVVGLRELRTNAAGRVYNLYPEMQIVFHVYQGQVTLSPDLPADIRQALTAVLS